MNFINANESWDWQDDEAWLEKDSRLEISQCVWDADDLLHLFDQTTPVKNCADLDYRVISGHFGENTSKGSEECREYSQLKRRRMLRFNSVENDPCICNEQLPYTFAKSTDGEDSLMDEAGDIDFSDALHEDLQWVSRFTEDLCSGSKGLDQSSDSWLDNCFNIGEMQISCEDTNFSGEDQVDISEFCIIPPEMETNAVQGSATPAPCSLFTGRKSLIRTPTKLATPVACPFALIKPCGVQGDVTLKDINQKILTPAKSKHVKDNDAPPSYPTSAFSGKPVVVKTNIRTEGGKGSITIMRMRG